MLTFITPLLYAWLVANFEPGQSILDRIYKLLPDKFGYTRQYTRCFKCLSFWITLGMTLNLPVAILFSIIAYTYDRLVNALPMFI